MSEDSKHGVQSLEIGMGILRAMVSGQRAMMLKDIAANGVTVTQLSAAEREAFVKATRPVFEKWKGQIGADLVTQAEKAIAARKQ